MKTMVQHYHPAETQRSGVFPHNRNRIVHEPSTPL